MHFCNVRLYLNHISGAFQACLIVSTSINCSEKFQSYDIIDMRTREILASSNFKNTQNIGNLNFFTLQKID